MKARKILALIVTFAIATIALVSCGGGGKPGDGVGEGESITLVVAGEATAEYTVYLENLTVNEGLVSVLRYLMDNGLLEYEISGTFLNKVGPLANDYAAGKYIYVYTSVLADIDVSQYAVTVEYDGKTLTSSGVGALDMHIEDGAVIYIGTIVYEG